MYEFVCSVCGKTIEVKKTWQVHTYCSKECAAKAREERRREARENVKVSGCIYQPESIMCDMRICSKCGWNPEVAKARLDKIKESL